MIDWIITNWLVIVEGYLALVGLASVIVKLTPTIKDDTVLKNILKFTGKIIALNRK